MLSVMLRTTLATLAAFLGGACGVVLERVAAHRLSLLVCMAAGVLLAVTLFDVLPDAYVGLSWRAFVTAVISGYLLFWLVGKYVYHICPACAMSHFEQQTTQPLGQTAALLLIALGIHSTMDGLAVVVSDKIAGHADVTVLMALSLHKFPEGMALALLLIGAGYSRRKALLWTLAIQATTELGGLLGLVALTRMSDGILSLIFAHVGGNFLYLIRRAFDSLSAQRRGAAARPLIVGGSLAFGLTAILIWATQYYAR